LESNWRWNVWEYGLGDYWVGVKQVLAARILEGFFKNYVVVKFAQGPLYGLYVKNAVTQQYDGPGTAGIPPGSHFPYGYVVEPDQ
jgi:hypothetical protein